MPDPSTTRLALYKSKSDGSELVNYTQDIGQNLDKIDAAVGFQSATSSTRPSSPYSGKGIFETDTSFRTLFSNGTSPASASWVEIPNSSATFNNNLKLASGKQVNIGASGSNASYVALLPTATGDYILASRVTSDSVSRITIRADGRLDWSTGALAADTNLYRSAANVLTTDDSLNVGINLTVTGNINTAANLAMGAWAAWTPTWATTNGLHTPSYGNAVIDCRYARIGRTIVYYLNITFGSTTNFGAGATGSDNWTFSLPVVAATAGAPIGKVAFEAGNTSRGVSGMAQVTTGDTGTLTLYIDSMRVDGTATAGGIADSVTPYIWASGMRVSVVGQYEAAS